MGDIKRKVSTVTGKVNASINTLRTSIDRKNNRLAPGHIDKLQASLDNLLEALVDAELEGIEETEAWMVKARKADQEGREVLFKGEEFISEASLNESTSAILRVNENKLEFLLSQVQEFQISLNTPAINMIEKSDDKKQNEALSKLLSDKQNSFKTYQSEKIDLISQECFKMDDDKIKKLKEIFKTVSIELKNWCDEANKYYIFSSSTSPTTTERSRGPELKLDRLTLPTFRGDVRHYARFIREFNSSVGHQFTDPKIKLMYLDQCLQGPAKECVRNMINFEEATERLKERFGKVELVLDSVLRDLKEIRIPEDEPRAVVALARYLERAWDDLDAIDATEEFCNIVTLGIIEGKLPGRIQILWAQSRKESSSKGKMVELKAFLERQRKIAEDVLAMRGKTLENEKGARARPKHDPKTVQSVNATPTKKCHRCGFNHLIKDCKVPATIECRWCHKKGHIENACRSKLAHNTDKEKKEKQESNPKGSSSSCNSNSSVKLPIEQVNTDHGTCNVLWDSGSMINLVSKKWVDKVGLRGKSCKLDFKVVDNSEKRVRTQLYNIALISKNGAQRIIQAYGIEELAAASKAIDGEEVNEIISKLNQQICHEDIDNEDRKVDLLIGSSCIGDFPVIKYKTNEACLMASEFGIQKYVVAGNYTSDRQYSEVSNVVCNAKFIGVTPLNSICEQFVGQISSKEFFEFTTVEEMGIRPPPVCKTCRSCQVCKPAAQFLSLKEHRELNVIKSKLSYNEAKLEWSASYPFIKDPSVLSNNYETTLKVLKRRERKLNNDPKGKELYDGQVQDFVKRGVIRKMTEKELQNWTGPVRYVDHHEVFKESMSTPVRIVINSSFRQGQELSFNDILMKGPNVLSCLFEVLVRWRMQPIGFVGDISKMYHTVKTGEVEGHLRRFLWRECDQTKEPDIYCFQTVTFGDRPAGCIVVSALRATADMFSHINKSAATILEKDSYMDDIVSGQNTLQEVKELIPKIEGIAEKGGFKFKKFIVAGECEASGKMQEEERVLGMNWKPSEDEICIRVEINHNKRRNGARKEAVSIESIPFSRRVCLRLVNGIFDPLGLFAPMTVKLKLLMKKHFVASEKYKKWDTRLEPTEAIEWVRALKDASQLAFIWLPRHPLTAPYPDGKFEGGKYALVCFADASQEAMCAAVYARFEGSTGVIDSALVSAKTKVSPTKPTTIPKLELCSALLGARLSNKVLKCIAEKEIVFDNKYFLMDSKIALGTINKGQLENEFNGNCAAEIRGNTEGFDFAWIPTEHNIADLGTRGASAELLGRDSDWQKGPEWLRQPVENWPTEMYPLEELPIINLVERQEPVIKAEKYSCIERLHKVTAFCFKFASSRRKGRGSTKNWKDIKLTPEDYKKAEQYWIKMACKEVVGMYEDEKLKNLRAMKVWDKEGKHLKIVTSGRVGELLKIGYDTEELTILDPNHPYTKLFLKKMHEEDHGGVDRTVWKSRSFFWIPQARKIVRQIQARCYRCRLLEKRQAGQLMAPLPHQRVLPTPAWTYTSLDLFGPLEHVDMVKKRLKEKCWGVIFTCMVSRAVHLDLTQAYHTDALLQAIRRFMSLRGCPKEFLSDQGTQMVACNKELSVALEMTDWSFVEGWCSRKGIAWKFVPPQGQHMNGVSESLIRVTKNQLRLALDGKRLNFVETQTVLHEIGQVMNSRPLGLYAKPGTDPLDGGPITPNHLLLGRATAAIPDLKFEKVSLTKRMKFIASCVEEFWTKWRIVVFHSLVPQYKWHKTQRNIAVGDVVLLNEDQAMVAEFRLGQVEEVKTSGDGLVRSAKVRTLLKGDNKFSFLDRPIHKLCIIVPVEEQ